VSRGALFLTVSAEIDIVESMDELIGEGLFGSPVAG
jgi:hypothetical protein